MLNAGDDAELGTLGKFGWIWRGLNPLSQARAHSAPLDTRASLWNCSQCMERKDEGVQSYKELDISKPFLGTLSLHCSALQPCFKQSHKVVKMKQGTRNSNVQNLSRERLRRTRRKSSMYKEMKDKEIKRAR